MNSTPGDKLRRCPVCRAVSGHRQTHPRGFWESRIFPLLGLRPFRCEFCRSRFLRFGGNGSLQPPAARRRKRRRSATPELAAPADNTDFKELIREIRDEETKRGLVTGPGDRPAEVDR